MFTKLKFCAIILFLTGCDEPQYAHTVIELPPSDLQEPYIWYDDSKGSQ